MYIYIYTSLDTIAKIAEVGYKPPDLSLLRQNVSMINA